MTRCPSANDLAQLLDGTLAGPRRTAVDSHLDHCLACTELVTELARAAQPGVTARRWIGDRPTLLARWLVVADKLADDHRRGIVHGGLSPDALFADGELVTITSAPDPAFTTIAELHGESATASGDQFSLCACMWASLVGQPPFRGSTPGALAVAMTSPPEAPDDDAIFAVLARGLSAEPAKRFASVDELARALRDPRRRIRILPIAIALAIIAIGATLLIGLR